MEQTTFFSSREQFAAFRTAFRKLANTRAISASDIILYNIARGLPMERGFTPITNSRKLAHGAIADHSLTSTVSSLKWRLKRTPEFFSARFDNALSKTDINLIITALGG